MRILLYGENWQGTHVNAISIVLNKMEVDNQIFDFYKYLNFNSKNRLLNRILRKLFIPLNEYIINWKFYKKIITYKPNAIIISKGVNIYPSTLKKIKSLNIKVVNWNPDDFFNQKNSSRHLRKSFDLFDIVFSAREHLFKDYLSRGLKNIIYLEWYYIPWLHKFREVSDVKRKITFIGTKSKRREKILGSINENYNIEIWGSGWSNTTLKNKTNVVIKNEVLNQKDFTEVISNSLINLNILTIENQDLTNLKIFEITSCGGFILTEDNLKSRELLNNYGFFYNEKTINLMIEQIYSLNFADWNYFRNITSNFILDNSNSINDRVNKLLDCL